MWSLISAAMRHCAAVACSDELWALMVHAMTRLSTDRHRAMAQDLPGKALDRWGRRGTGRGMPSSRCALYTMKVYSLRDDLQVDERSLLAVLHGWTRPVISRGGEARISLHDVPAAGTGLNMSRLSPVRRERELDSLQCIEAIRLYVAAHEGKLPPTLEAITDVPVPLDPATESLLFTR